MFEYGSIPRRRSLQPSACRKLSPEDRRGPRPSQNNIRDLPFLPLRNWRRRPMVSDPPRSLDWGSRTAILASYSWRVEARPRGFAVLAVLRFRSANPRVGSPSKTTRSKKGPSSILLRSSTSRWLYSVENWTGKGEARGREVFVDPGGREARTRGRGEDSG